MAVAGVKYDDGSNSYAINCFPVRSILRQSEEGAGAWKVAYRQEELRRFNACIVTKPSQLKLPQKHEGEDNEDVQEEEEGAVLDGFFLLSHCCVDDPSDLCSVKISGLHLAYAIEDDFDMFDNVAYINAGENLLPLEAYRRFAELRELEIPFCDITEVSLKFGEFKNLVMLDLSYNNLRPASLLQLGLMSKLRVLHLTGNGLRSLPEHLAGIISDDNNQKALRFPSLEVLMLDDNQLWSINTFTKLSGLRKLQHLNLEKNYLSWVPHLKLVENVITSMTSKSGSRCRSGFPSPESPPPEANFLPSKSTKRSDEMPVVLTIDTVDTVTSQADRATEPDEHTLNVTEQTASETTLNPANTVADDRQGEETLSGAEEPVIFASLDIDEKLQEFEIGEEVRRTSMTPRTKFRESFMVDMPPPFSELQFINLAHNQFEREEGLLAVAVWPSLADIDLHGNPMITQHIGDPPLLTQFLRDRLGINLFRAEPSRPTKQPLQVSCSKARKVSTYVPTVTRPSLEERMMLEFPPPQMRQTTTTARSLSATKPLPPIKSEESPLRPYTATGEFSSRPLSAASCNSQNNAIDGDPFFVTQDEYQEDVLSGRNTGVDVSETELADDTHEQRNNHALGRPGSVFQGYEELLDIDDSLDDGLMELPKDLPGNLRALKYALTHQRVYRDAAVSLKKVGKAHKPHDKPLPIQYVQHNSKIEKINNLLAELCNKTTYTDTPLQEIIKNPNLNKKSLPEAVNLLRRVEKRYNTVQADPSKTLVEATAVIQESLDNVIWVNRTT